MDKPDKSLRFLGKLFWTTLSLSAFTFGGGFVIVSLMRKKMVEQYHWIDDEQMLDFVTIAQSCPGPIAVNGALIVGYHLAGFIGAMAALLGTILPPMIILSIVSLVYRMFQGNPWVAAAFYGMRPVVAAIVLQVVWSLLKPFVHDRKFIQILVCLGVFCLLFFLKINVVFIMLCSLVLSAAYALYQAREAKR
ncbi:MAG: chromate transporter [Sphaerochaetaceae bacterium]|jgi:chromate transporter